jgi:RHS repeat-associated protein
VSFNYDNRNRLESEIDVFGHTIAREYELTVTVNQKRLKFDGALYAKYNLDDADRLTSINDSTDNTTISFGYDEADKLKTRVLPNGVTTTYDYDNIDRLKRLKDVSSTATLFDRNYRYNTASQIDQIVEPTQTRSFGYDNVDRLTSATYSNPTQANESYNYDDVGNRTSSHKSTTYGYQTGQFNRVTSTANSNYNYDANGNMTTKAEGKELWRFTWDYENRLTTAATRRQTVRYRYDALGRRVQRYIVGGKENTKFIYDGNDVLVDDNNGTLTKYQNGLGIDNKLKMVTNGTAKYFLTDHLGSTSGLANASGNLTEQTAYDSFGNATNNLSTRYQYTGREFDNFTGLHYYRARWYDGNLGRFISEDPIGFGGGDVNLYGYVGNNSVMLTDPSGEIVPLLALVIVAAKSAAIGAAIGAAAVIITKGIGNVYNNKNFFHCIKSPGYWIDVSIGAAGGALVGALTPIAGAFAAAYGGLSAASAGLASAVALNAVGNGLQYGASVGLGRTQYSHLGLGISIGAGALGGRIGGRFPYNKPNSSILTNEADRALIDKAAQETALYAGVGTSVGVSSLGKSIGGAVTGNGGSILDACECE